jgi:hypothetical protein
MIKAALRTLLWCYRLIQDIVTEETCTFTTMSGFVVIARSLSCIGEGKKEKLFVCFLFILFYFILVSFLSNFFVKTN